MTVARGIALSVLALAAFSPAESPAHAQPAEPITDEQRERARPIVDEANAAFDQNDYQAALERYQAAYEIAPVDALRFNIARCLERLARFREAASVWEALVESAALDEEQRATAAEQLAFVRARLATVVIEAQPGYERVTIDGDLECRLPCELALDPGSHLAIARGAREARRAFDLGRGERLVLAFESPEPIAPATGPVEPEPASFSVSWLGWTGVALAVAGAAAAVVFGVRTIDLVEEFDLNPQERLADEGDVAWGLMLGGVGLAGAGVALLLVDLLAQPFAD
jgi:tetratricopeptide (TPR) repeat protein